MLTIKPRVYLDTTVPSAMLDDRAPLRQEVTRAFWNLAAEKYRLIVSELTRQEVERTPNSERRGSLLALIDPLEVLSATPEAAALAGLYVEAGIVPAKYLEDALHLSTASVHAVTLVASWNFRHMVKVETKNRVNAVNAAAGYPALDIVTPEQL